MIFFDPSVGVTVDGSNKILSIETRPKEMVKPILLLPIKVLIQLRYLLPLKI